MQLSLRWQRRVRIADVAAWWWCNSLVVCLSAGEIVLLDGAADGKVA